LKTLYNIYLLPNLFLSISTIPKTEDIELRIVNSKKFIDVVPVLGIPGMVGSVGVNDCVIGYL